MCMGSNMGMCVVSMRARHICMFSISVFVYYLFVYVGEVDVSLCRN